MIQISPIPAFKDNYLWLIENEQEAWIVDPGDAEPVQQALAERGRQLTGILITHHHRDHIGGVPELAAPGVQIIGPRQEQYELVNDPVGDDDLRSVCGLEFRVIEVPGHTLNHLAYFAQPQDQSPILFCGDTLFAAGCGRLFEGTPAQMYHSLGKLAALPNDTRVYCAHEYTRANLRFAQSIEPHNTAVARRISEVEQLRDQGVPSIPTTIELEKQTNPFLRIFEDEVVARASAAGLSSSATANPEEIFAVIRQLKDEF